VKSVNRLKAGEGRQAGASSRPNVTHTEWQIPASHRYSNVLRMMGTWMPETCREVK